MPMSLFVRKEPGSQFGENVRSLSEVTRRDKPIEGVIADRRVTFDRAV